MAGQPGEPQNSFGWPSSFLAGLGPLGSLTPVLSYLTWIITTIILQTKKTLLVVINIFLIIKHPTRITEPEVRNPSFPNA